MYVKVYEPCVKSSYPGERNAHASHAQTWADVMDSVTLYTVICRYMIKGFSVEQFIIMAYTSFVGMNVCNY